MKYQVMVDLGEITDYLNLECWNCGKSYDTTKTEECPKCREHKDDEPRDFHEEDDE